MKHLSIFLFFLLSRLLYAVDYDCAFIGTSPIPLLEAIYQSYLGKKVIIFEQAAECGGAWKSIEICGIPHVDMGCHDATWSDPSLSEFFENYIGCKIVSFHSSTQPSSGPYWFSRGCYELIGNLCKMVAKTSIELRMNCRVLATVVENDAVVLSTQQETFSAKKIYVTPLSEFSINQQPVSQSKSKYYHLYLLISDPTPPKFTSKYLGNGVSRMMNLTHSAELSETGRQLLVLQTYSEQEFYQGQRFIDLLKMMNLIGPSAYLLRAEAYVYEASYGCAKVHSLCPEYRSFFEVLNTGSLGGMSSYVKKWKEVLPLYQE